MLIITLDKICPICRTRLELCEASHYVEIRCRRCGIGIRFDMEYVRNITVRGNVLDWRGTIEYLILDFYREVPNIMRIRGVGQSNKSTNILENIW